MIHNNYVVVVNKNLMFYGRSKHIDTKYHFTKSCLEKGKINIHFVNFGD